MKREREESAHVRLLGGHAHGITADIPQLDLQTEQTETDRQTDRYADRNTRTLQSIHRFINELTRPTHRVIERAGGNKTRNHLIEGQRRTGLAVRAATPKTDARQTRHDIKR